MKKVVVIFLILTIISLISACNDKSAFPEIEEPNPYAQELVGWMPVEGMTFKYEGSFDYLHSETVVSVTDDFDERTYFIEGEVSSNTVMPTRFSYTYSIDENRVAKSLSGFGMTDDKFMEMTLIKLPVQVGNKWTETVKDAYGSSYEIEGSIVSLDEYNGKSYLEVHYEDKNSDYYEIRRFESGTGIVYCAVNYEYGGQSTELSYSLNDEYIEQEAITVDKEEVELSQPTHELEDNASKDEREMITALIQDFNDAWILFINEDDLRVYEYLMPGEPAYKSVSSFNKTGLKERFVLMEVKEVHLDGERAFANVHEEIEHIRENEVKTVTYEWTYEMVQTNGIWLIVNYYDNR